jgi:WD40 repeat protein
MTSVGTHIYSSANKSLKIWDVETMNYISDLQIEKIGLVKAIAFWKERNLLLTAAERVIMMWDVISLTTVGKFTGFKEDIKALQLLQGTDLMFAASKGTPTSGALLIYDLRKYQQPLDEKERNQDIFSLTASSSHVFYGCRNHTVNPFCIKTFTSLASLSPPHFDVVTSLAVLGKQDSNLISGSRDKNLRRYSIKDG